jgi:hypothetical protein
MSCHAHPDPDALFDTLSGQVPARPCGRCAGTDRGVSYGRDLMAGSWTTFTFPDTSSGTFNAGNMLMLTDGSVLVHNAVPVSWPTRTDDASLRKPRAEDRRTGHPRLAGTQRRLWDAAMIAEGEAILEAALRKGRPGPYQLHAAIAACHSSASSADRTDWRQIALLYAELIRYEPTPVVEANRAVALAMAEGPAAGLVILDALAHHPQLQCWAQLHIALAELLKRLGRQGEGIDVYTSALELGPAPAARSFIARRIRELSR